MTRWKREETTTFIRMYAHNQHSHWNDHLHQAAHELGLDVAFRQYPNGSGDGSWDREWYVSSPWLARVGGMARIKERAHELSEIRHEARRQREAEFEDSRA
jgi:hypothetical protein